MYQAATVVDADLTSQEHGHVGIVPATGTPRLCRPATNLKAEFCEQLSCCSAAWPVLSPAAVDAHME